MSYRTPKICFWHGDDGLWRFALVGANGEPQAASQGYKTKGGLQSGIFAARRNWRRAVVVEAACAPSRKGKQ